MKTEALGLLRNWRRNPLWQTHLCLGLYDLAKRPGVRRPSAAFRGPTSEPPLCIGPVSSMNTGHRQGGCRLLTSCLTRTALVLGLLAAMVAPVRVHADGCFVAPPFVWNKAKDINEPTQKAILVFAAGHEDLILQVKYNGPVRAFGWLVPVPSRPTVQAGSMECFYELSRYTQEHWEPRLVAADQTRGRSVTPMSAAAGPPPPPVQVIEIKTVGAYEVAVLSAAEPGSLEKWLADNQFAFPKDKASVIDDYIRRHWYFVAVKIDLAKAGGFQLLSGAPRRAAAVKSAVAEKLSEGELQPLQLGFASDQCVFPLKISSVNGTPSEVQVYVLSPEPLVERTLFEKKFADVTRQAVEQHARSLASEEHMREYMKQLHQRMNREAEEMVEPPVETNVPMDLILKSGVPQDALLPYAAVWAEDFPACARAVPQFKGKTWWLTKQTWTFQPAEMRDLLFAPAATVFGEDLAGDASFYVAQNLARLGPNAVPVLRSALQCPDPRVRIHAGSVLEEGYNNNFTVAHDPNYTVSHDPGLLACLPALFKDPEWEVRMDAAAAAGENWNPQYAGPLINLLQDKNVQVQQEAVSALRRKLQGRVASLPALQKLLADDNLAVRANAVEVISTAGTPVPKADLLPLLGVPDMRAVSLAISQLRATGLSHEDLTPLLHNSLTMARLAGLQLFRELGDKDSIGDLIPLLRDPEPRVQSRAWALLKTLSGEQIPQAQPDQWAQWWARNKNPVLIAEYTRFIQANPARGEEYHMRGCLYYDNREFAKALADFRQACQLGSEVPDYSHYRVWLIRARTGEVAAATRDLRAYLESRRTGRPADWPSTVGRFLAGQLDEAAFLKAAEDPDARTSEEQQCEAWFYAGMKRLISNDRPAAIEYLQKCLATHVTNFEEYASAEAELKSLQMSPAQPR